MTLKLRDYQQQSTEVGIAHLENGKGNGVIVVPTGGGKSLIISRTAAALDGRTLILQPSKEILEQNYRKTFEFGQTDIGIYSASFNSKKISKITFATIGSIVKKPDIFADFDRILMDECDAANPKDGMYRQFLAETGIPVLGYTATPYRLHSATSYNGPCIKFITRTRPRIFSEILHITQSKELFARNYLCPIWYQTESYDQGQLELKSSGVDYTEESVRRYNKSIRMVEKILHYVQSTPANHILTFCSTLAEAREVAELCDAAGISTRLVSADTPDEERASILSAFKGGRVRHVVNVGVLAVGFDFPALDCIVGARPTNSVRLYYQMIGRGIRINPGKEFCRYIDLVGNVKRFGKVEEFEITGIVEKKHRLKSDVGFLTGVDMKSGLDLENADLEIKRPDPSQHNPMAVIRYGAHKGKRLAYVPLSYLKFVAEKFDDGPNKKQAIAEIERRAKKEAENVG